MRPRERSGRWRISRRRRVGSRRIALLLLCAACHKSTDEETAPPVLAVKTERVSRGDVTPSVEVPGQLAAVPGADVKLGPLVAGRLGRVLVAEGDRVKPDQILASLDITPLRDAVEQVEAQLAQARAQQANAQSRLARAEKALAAGGAAGAQGRDPRPP